MEGYIDIYAKSTQLKLSVPITAKSTWKKELMSEEYITLYFNARTYVTFELGDYASWNGKTWYVVKRTFPKQSKKQGFEYELRLDSKETFWQNRIIMYDRQTAKEGYWKLTGTASMFMQIVTSNIDACGLGYYEYVINLTDLSVAKFLQFESVSIWDALTKIAEAFDAEWWVSGNTIYLGKCELGTNFELTDEFVENTNRSNSSDENYLTRIYPLGSTRNIPTNYRPEEDQLVTEGIVEKRLKIPAASGSYIDAWENMTDEEIVEGFVIFDDVYPRRIGTISQVIEKQETTTDEEGNEKQITIYRFKDSGLNFNESYILPNQALEAYFDSGLLNGRTYELKFNPLGKQSTDPDYNMFEIIINSNYGTDTPNSVIKPAVGDTYILSGFDTSYVSDTYLPAAEEELEDVATAYVQVNGIYKSVYDCTMRRVRCAGIVNGEYSASARVTFDVGQKVLLKTMPYFGENGLESRVRAFEKKLANIYDATFTIGDADKYSRIGSLSAEVKGVSLSAAVKVGETGSGTSIYLIKLYDSTTPSEYNAYSASRAKAEFLSKKEADTAEEKITFNKGLITKSQVKSDNFVSGFAGWEIDRNGNAEFETAHIRSALEVDELRINRQQAQEGDTIFSDNDQITAVEEIIDETDQSVSYILTLKEKWEGYFTAQQFGNIIRGKINTLAAKEAGVSDYSASEYASSQGTDAGGNKYYTSFMRVIGTHNTMPAILGLNQIQVVLFGDSDVPMLKNYPPCALMAIARWGCVDYADPQDPHYADVLASIRRRQQLFMLSTSDGRIVKLVRVNKPILENWMFGTSLGILPDFVQNYPEVSQRVIEGRDYLYAQGVVVGDFIKVDITGAPIASIVFCEDWVDGSQIQNPTVRHGIYYNATFNEQAQQFETHEVRHMAGLWRCLQNQPVVSGGVSTYYEPKWNSPYWLLVDGNDNLSIEFVSSRGYSFRRGAVDTLITPHLFYGNVDITDDVAAEYWVWERESESGKTDADRTWDAQHAHQKTLQLTNNDMPASWSFQDKAIFTCTVTINDGKSIRIVQNQIIS